MASVSVSARSTFWEHLSLTASNWKCLCDLALLAASSTHVYHLRAQRSHDEHGGACVTRGYNASSEVRITPEEQI